MKPYAAKHQYMGKSKQMRNKNTLTNTGGLSGEQGVESTRCVCASSRRSTQISVKGRRNKGSDGGSGGGGGGGGDGCLDIATGELTGLSDKLMVIVGGGDGAVPSTPP